MTTKIEEVNRYDDGRTLHVYVYYKDGAWQHESFDRENGNFNWASFDERGDVTGGEGNCVPARVWAILKNELGSKQI